MTTQAYRHMIQRAHDILRATNPRAGYAHDVLSGRQCWSGADLQGTAKRYGGSYARQRSHARRALLAAGGTVIALAPNGLLVTALSIGMDDYGSGLYQTDRGVAVAGSSARCTIIA